jgi:hypothetical protein
MKKTPLPMPKPRPAFHAPPSFSVVVSPTLAEKRDSTSCSPRHARTVRMLSTASFAIAPACACAPLPPVSASEYMSCSTGTSRTVAHDRHVHLSASEYMSCAATLLRTVFFTPAAQRDGDVAHGGAGVGKRERKTARDDSLARVFVV